MIGRQLDTGLAHVNGTKSFVPPWQYDYGESYFIGGAISRSLIELDGFARVEFEGGVGKRFGGAQQSEAWTALYFRWLYFPWNSFLRTSVAVSTGLSYASGVTNYEIGESVDGRGSRLLHYFSPEIAFAIPSKPATELAIRFHHRSGGGEYFGESVPVYGSLFRGAHGGMQYLTLGLRQYF